MNSEFQFTINITQEEYLRYYAGKATAIQVKSLEGLLIQFPASALKPWITHHGISGHFKITFDKNNKLIEVKKII